MRKPLVVALCALALAGAGVTPAVAAVPTPTGADTAVGTGAGAGSGSGSTTVLDVVDGVAGTAADTLSGLTGPKAAAVNFAGTVSLSNCSGSVGRPAPAAGGPPPRGGTHRPSRVWGVPPGGEGRRDR
ncbi:serine protease, partial [Streptomyces hirsutus]